MVSSIIVESVRDSGIHACGFLYPFEYYGDYFWVNLGVARVLIRASVSRKAFHLTTGCVPDEVLAGRNHCRDVPLGKVGEWFADRAIR